MAALSSYHNIWMMNQAASKSVVMLLTQGFLPSPCPVGPEGGTETRERGFVQPRCLFVMRSAVYLVCCRFCFDNSQQSCQFVLFFPPIGFVLLKVYSEPRDAVLAVMRWTVLREDVHNPSREDAARILAFCLLV